MLPAMAEETSDQKSETENKISNADRYHIPFVFEAYTWKPQNDYLFDNNMRFYDHSVKTGNIPAPFTDRSHLIENTESKQSFRESIYFIPSLLYPKSKIMRRFNLEFSQEMLVQDSDTYSFSPLNHHMAGKREIKTRNRYAGLNINILHFRWMDLIVSGGVNKSEYYSKSLEIGFTEPHSVLSEASKGSVSGTYTGYKIFFPLIVLNKWIFKKLDKKLFFTLWASRKVVSGSKGTANFTEFYGDGNAFQISHSKLRNDQDIKEYGLSLVYPVKNDNNSFKVILGFGYRKDQIQYYFPGYIGMNRSIGGNFDLNEILEDHLLYSNMSNKEELHGSFVYLRLAGISLE